MVRDLSPNAYVAPGPSSISFNDICSAQGPEPEPMDMLVSNYSPSTNIYYNFAGSSTMVTVATIFPGYDTNVRWVEVVMPRGNTNAITLKGVTGDTGVPLNPNGITVLPVPSGSGTWGFTMTVATTGVLFKFR